jgi:hypothetical protein
MKKAGLCKLTINRSVHLHTHTAELPPRTAKTNAENLKQIFPEKEYRGLSPNFHIHVSVNELYSHGGSACSAGGNIKTDPGNI